ncbi:MAG TPA: DUF5069 domain-containing protein [Opitutaceae bacterium]|nr:DUF5069 domain-containing protein [Opitutaceae bacterium]
MKHYDFPAQFRALYDQAVSLYSKGGRGAATYFDKAQVAWLAGNGITPQYMYDYAEDEVSSGEPGFGHAIAIELCRRSYFLDVQGGKPSGVVLDESTMPAKTDSVRGIEWLPRIIPKGKAKLRGELPENLMYCCGGDRRFFKANNILPAELLGVLWRNGDDDKATVEWVAARAKAAL